MNKISPSQPIWVMALTVFGIMAAAAIFGMQFNPTFHEYDSVSIIDQDSVVIDSLIAPPLGATDSASTVAISHSDSTPVIRQQDLYFHYHMKFLVWMFFFCLLIGVSFGFILPIAAELKSLGSWISDKKKLISRSVVGAVVIVLVAFSIAGGSWMNLFQPGDAEHYLSFASIMHKLDILLKDPKVAVFSLMMLGSVGPIMAMSGILLVNFSIPSFDRLGEIELVASRFKKASKSLNFFLFALALMISLTTVTTALGRDAVAESVPWAADFLVPMDFVYLYGLIFTAILAIVYIPIFFQLKRKGEALLKEIVEVKESAVSGQTGEGLVSADIRGILLLKPTSLDQLKVSLSILGPVLTGLLSKFIEI